MADFISTLTGVQMDAALLDMAEHNSEAWAVGERNGTDVNPDDVTYHNNARYYAQQAQSIAPASVTEAVRWDVAQTALTDAQREQARENIKATSYNYNLLDNGWFLLNSRGQSSYSSNGYTVDRWRTTNSNGTVTVNSNGVTLTANSNGNAFLVQYTNDGYEGIYTYSAYIKGSGAGYIGVTNADRSTVLSSKTFNNVGDNWTLISGTFTTSSTAIGTFTIRVNSGTSIDIKSVKLELGSVSTLANDAPQDYGEELARCIYSTADPTDNYANNGFGRTNPNLLDNPWFTVNQRGQSSYGSSVYGVDRWFVTQNASVNVLANGLELTTTANSWGMEQRCVKNLIPHGTTVTFSALIDDGEIVQKSFVWNGASTIVYPDGSAVGLEINTAPTAYDRWYVCNTIASTHTIHAVKIEIGSFSTLANDTPPDYGTELAKCKYYFRRIAPNGGMAVGFGAMAATNTGYITIPAQMRTSGTITASFSGTATLRGAGASGTVTAISVQAVETDGVRLNVIISGSIAGNQPAMLWFENNSYLDLSADL